jgi:hypothetical protein
MTFQRLVGTSPRARLTRDHWRERIDEGQASARAAGAAVLEAAPDGFGGYGAVVEIMNVSVLA